MHTIIRAKRALVYISMPFLIAASCTKGDMPRPCRTTVYSFAVNSSFNPEKKLYKVGDSIFLNISFTKNLKNLTSGELIDYSNAFSIGGNLFTALLDTSSHQVVDGLDKFGITKFIGSASSLEIGPNGGINIFMNEGADSYDFKLALILKEKGIFRFGVPNLSSVGIKNKNCTNAGFEMTVTNANKHLDLFEYAIGYYPDALAEKGIYCFRVVE